MPTKNYDANSIEVLEGLEPVRKRPGMYIGGTDIHGLHHLVYEIVDNSVDEAMQGFGNRIDVTIGADSSVSVRDFARGIPIDMHAKMDVSALEVVMTTLHAGGKFDSGAYVQSGGLHGVGASVVNALSEWCRVEVRQKGKVFMQEYERGKRPAPSRPSALPPTQARSPSSGPTPPSSTTSTTTTTPSRSASARCATSTRA